jgi:anthranilate phosphoribosyltransferase
MSTHPSTTVPATTREVLYRLTLQRPVHDQLLREGFADAFAVADPALRGALLASILTGLIAKGATVDEVITLVDVVIGLDGWTLDRRVRLHDGGGPTLVGVKGSGKKGVKTINVSTPSCLLAAAAGAAVAKIGSSGTASYPGSLEFAAQVGINVDLDHAAMAGVLRATSFAYVNTELTYVRFVSLYKGIFHVPHALIFGWSVLLPVHCDVLFYGVAHPDVDLSLKVARHFGIRDGTAVSCTDDGLHYLDEMGISGTTYTCAMRGGEVAAVQALDTARELDLPRYNLSDLREQGSLRGNVDVVVQALSGRGSPAHRDVLCVNAAEILVLGGVVGTRAEGFARARACVAAGAVIDKLREIVKASGGSMDRLESYLTRHAG